MPDNFAPDETHTTAAAIYEKVSELVVGQEGARRDLSTLLAMHLAWFSTGVPDISHSSPNALVIGPTGVGKTHAIKTAAAALKIPLVIVDATQLSPHGYQGMSLEDVLIELVSASRRIISHTRDGNTAEGESGGLEEDGIRELDELDTARRGIIFIDEFDKLSTKNKATGERNELLQRRLLQFIDGASVVLNPKPDHAEEEITFETSGILFIAAGAFTNLLHDTGKRSQEQMRDMLQHNHVILEDLVRFGFMEELVARLPVIIEFSELDTEALEEILRTEAVDPSLFYVRYLASLGTKLTVTDQARTEIAERARRLRIGARGLHQVLFPILALLSQDLEEDRVTDFTLDVEQVRKLARRVEARRNVR